MPVFRKAVDRLACLLRGDHRITYRAHIHPRVAPYVTPLLDRIVADDEDGDTFRNALIPWRQAQRPPIAIYRGDASTCRIEGPWQVANEHWLPLGGLIVTSGVTVQLNPFEAQALHKRMQQAIDDTVLAWVREHDLYALHPIPEEIDRTVADPAAKALIAAWAAGQRKAGTMPDAGPARPAGKGRTMPEPAARTAALQGCDAPHRASNFDTHLTHGCIQRFRHFSRVRRECAKSAARKNTGFARVFESARRTLGEAAL